MRTDPSGIRRWLIRVAEVAPVAAIGLLIALPHLLPTQFVPSEAMIARNLEIRAAIDDVPWIIGDWRGREVEVPEAARRILKPNAMLSRRYVREAPDGGGMQAATFVLIHCSDTRDMNGHEPSVCYPSAGWAPVGESYRTHTFRSDLTGEIVVNESIFRAPGAVKEHAVRILNFYVLPDGTTTHDPSELSQRAGRERLAVLGVAQIQLVGSASMPLDRALAILRELIDGTGEPLEALFETKWEERPER